MSSAAVAIGFASAALLACGPALPDTERDFRACLGGALVEADVEADLRCGDTWATCTDRPAILARLAQDQERCRYAYR